MRKIQWCGALCLALVLTACGESKPKPELVLQDIRGQQVSLQTLQGKPVVINMWATWCAPCRREMPLLQQAQKSHNEVQFVLLNQGEKAAAVSAYLQQNQLNMPHVWLDEAMQARTALPYQGLPSTYFLNKNGEVVAHSLGELSPEQLQQYLAQIQ
ncbi:TlpA family protein disulfide reductase [Vitreoscilla massiliensis]|uniref:TlpA family protein disulfide reductase n=1 Tax=Vitreoscilla massiliensis TaxID=1689272 RepID=A0ABY4E4Q2_9NEIS|nr:TlpA disulfide reductase family protein [Vitreoscilla massiliensis]UOO90743.1 TlpA family protein disulfide reductase [Vitreoscilla massiliensis]